MRFKLSYAVTLLALAACGEESHDVTESDPTGSLALTLTGTSRNGDRFRLRDATFDISGCADNYYPGSFSAGVGGGSVSPNCTSTSVSSEEHPDDAIITKRLIPGYYYVSLRDGWFMEQLTAAGWSRVDALLLTSSSQNTYVWENGVSQLDFAFGVGGTLIDFRHGDLSIGIQVEHPGDRDCYYGGFAGGPACVAAGSGGSLSTAGVGASAGAPGGFAGQGG